MRRIRSSRREFLTMAGAGLAAAALSRRASAKENAMQPPNVVILLTDDQGWGDVRSHGNPRIDTPHMDRMAEEGARFDRFFVSPVCAPTRASLLTGRYALRTGVTGVARGQETMRASEATLAEMLRGAGYATGCFGKWHNGAYYPHHPNGQGFDEFLGFCCGHWNNYFDTGLEHNGVPCAPKGYINDVLTDAALEFIDANRGRPFLCYVPYNTPHSPFQVPDKYFDKYKAQGLDDTLACVYGMCESLDDCLGRVLAKLDQHGLADNTIVLFFGDNGPNTDRYNGGMRGRKGSVHEGGTRNLLFMRWPARIKPGTVVKPIAAHIDLLPTLAACTGAALPRVHPLDGMNLLPWLTGETDATPGRMLFEFFRGRGAVRTQQYRFVREGRRGQLYDMIADPGQERDIAEDKPEVAARFKAAYEAWLADAMPENTDPPPMPVGYREMPRVEMPTPEAEWEGELRFGGKHANNNWVTNWITTAEAVRYDIDVVKEGVFNVTLKYICAEPDVGARIQVGAAGKRVEGVIEQPKAPNFVPSPDRVPRQEVYERVWGLQPLGTITLPEGRTQLEVRALEIPGAAAMDLKSVILERVE